MKFRIRGLNQDEQETVKEDEMIRWWFETESFGKDGESLDKKTIKKCYEELELIEKEHEFAKEVQTIMDCFTDEATQAIKIYALMKKLGLLKK